MTSFSQKTPQTMCKWLLKSKSLTPHKLQTVIMYNTKWGNGRWIN